MYALDATTGATLWVGPAQGLPFVNSAAFGGGLVFSSALFRTMLAYDAGTGEIAWTSRRTDVRASPTLQSRTLYVGDVPGILSALDAGTGTTKWSSVRQGSISNQAPVIAYGRVFHMRDIGTLTAYNGRDGTQVWVKSQAFSEGTQAAAYGMLFYNEYPNVVAIDAATGQDVWRVPVLVAETPTSPAVAYGRVFVTQSKLSALDATTGAVLWQADVASSGGPSVANGVVYASSQNGEWDAFDASNGQLLWSVTIGNSCGGICTTAVPVVANGMLFLAGPDDRLRAYGLPR
jgi:outer membrane protein assembly factor BamB